jgi:hypothetical protein
MSERIEKSLLDIDFAALTARRYTPSPAAWEDQVLYFLLVDRFSDGNERGEYHDNNGNPVPSGTTPLYTATTSRVDYEEWLQAGGTWQGGTIKGLKDKLGYLKRLGVTALWVSPVFRQVPFEPSYHGYGIQNFLDVDPHFGTREELAISCRLPTIMESTSFSTSSRTTREMSLLTTLIVIWSTMPTPARATTIRVGMGIVTPCAGSMIVTVSQPYLGTSTIEPGSKVRGLMALSGPVNSKT